MKRIYWITFLTICTCNVFSSSQERKCFNFTWIGPTINEGTVNESIPCIGPPIYNDTIPDTTKMWDEYKSNSPDYLNDSITNCNLICIKYTYMYNGLAISASHFCGKVIEDQTPVTTGCYVTHTEGYTTEVCACRSEANEKPCNSAIRNTYSILITFMATVPLFIYKIFNIP